VPPEPPRGVAVKSASNGNRIHDQRVSGFFVCRWKHRPPSGGSCASREEGNDTASLDGVTWVADRLASFAMRFKSLFMSPLSYDSCEVISSQLGPARNMISLANHLQAIEQVHHESSRSLFMRKDTQGQG
jgi:hypothetical protein